MERKLKLECVKLHRHSEITHASKVIVKPSDMSKYYLLDQSNKDRKPSIIFFSLYNIKDHNRMNNGRNILNIYHLKKTAMLLNLGDRATRSLIGTQISKSSQFTAEEKKKFRQYFDFDTQTSSGIFNYFVHDIMKRYYRHRFHGTIVDSTPRRRINFNLGEEFSDFQEVVIWTKHTQLLQKQRTRV